MDQDGTAITNAAIVYQCADGLGGAVHAVSGSRGEFVMPVEIGCAYAGCTISVTTPNGKSLAVEAMASCVETRLACSNGCSRVEARIVVP